MQRYIQQLLADLLRIQLNPPDVDESYYDLPITEQIFIEGEETEYLTLEEYFDISYESFPPTSLLTLQQIKTILRALEEMMEAHNISCGWPRGLHAKRKYNILLDSWNAEMVGIFPMSDSEMQFCDHDPTNCPFGNNKCACLWVHMDTILDSAANESLPIREEDDTMPF